MIHPTAIIDPKAELGPDCEIGPYCVVGAESRLGSGCRLLSHVVVDGATELGPDNTVYPFVTIGLQTQDLKWRGGVTRTVIGSGNTFREGVTIHSATGDGEETVIGSHNTILAYCHVAHNCRLGDGIIMSNNTGLAGHVDVEDNVVIGGYVGVHQFCRIGRLAMVGGFTRINQDVAPFALVEGNPARARALNTIGLQRKNIAPETIEALKQTFQILFKSGLTTSNALEKLRAKEGLSAEEQQLAAFFESSERGVTR